MTRIEAGQQITPTLKLVRKIGAGAMGYVWAAENLALSTQVAVKVMAPGHVHDEDSILRFRQEAQAAAKIRSPYVATIFDHGITAEGLPFIVMELLEGEPLAGRLKRLGPLPFEDVSRLFTQIAKGVGAAHKLGVIHRDIKPHNLFVIDDEGHPFVKVLDFGIAKILDAGPGLTSTGLPMGTPLYMSPEQFGDSKRVDHRTDLWAMGVVVYELLTGKHPFSGSTVIALALAVMKGVFERPSSLRHDLPVAVDAWMTKALSVTPDGRFGGAAEMAEALSIALQNRSEPGLSSASPPSAYSGLAIADTVPLSPKKPTAVTPPNPRANRIRDLLGRQKPQGMEQPLGAGQLGDAPELVVTDDQVRGLLSISEVGNSGRAITFDERGEALYIGFDSGEIICFDLATKCLRWWHRLLARPTCFGLGAGSLAVGCTDGMIRLLDCVRGVVQRTITHSAALVRAVAIDPQAKTLAACGDGQRVVLWSLASSERLAQAEEHSEGVRGIAFDSKNRLWASGARDATVRIWDASLRPLRVLNGAKSVVRCVAFAPDGSYLIAGCDDGNVTLWATSRWELVKTFTGQTSRIFSVAFLTGAGIAGALVSGSQAGTMRVFSVATGQSQFTLGAGSSRFGSVAVSPDGRRIASTSADGKVQVYRFPLHASFSASPI